MFAVVRVGWCTKWCSLEYTMFKASKRNPHDYRVFLRGRIGKHALVMMVTEELRPFRTYLLAPYYDSVPQYTAAQEQRSSRQQY